jgi:serine/threonine protein kinase
VSSVVAEIGSTSNNYRILAKLATGGMADIFLARGAGVGGIERYVVLKRVLRERAGDAHFVQMFLEEARLAAQLNHPNVAQVYDLGRLGDSYFFTMEFVHGETVRMLLMQARNKQQQVPVAHVLTVIAGAASGLHHAHERVGVDGRPLGVVHRDVSPSNLMISFEGAVKVVDFGVAKAENRTSNTRTGAVKGKISYLSPEQCRGLPVDRRSDLFTLGIVLWEMLTTERLFRRSSDFENMTAIVTEAAPPPSAIRPGLAPEVDELTLRLLAKDPKDRFQTADELVETIEDIAKRHGALLSTTGLGRYMRELFGSRREPWLELEQITARDDKPAEGVTVTSDPGLPVMARPINEALAMRDALGSEAVFGRSDSRPGLGDDVPTVRERPGDMQAVLAALPVMDRIGATEDEVEPPVGQQPAWRTRVLTTARVAPLDPSPRSPASRFWLASILGVAAIACVVVAASLLGTTNGSAVPPRDAASAPDSTELSRDAGAVIVQPIIEPDAAPVRETTLDASIPDAAVETPVDMKTGDKKVPKGRPKPPKKDCAKDPMACQH